MKSTNIDPLLQHIQAFLFAAGKGETSVSEDIVEEFEQACGEALRKALNQRKPDEKTVYRMSMVGRPMCQNQMEVAKAEKQPNDYASTMKFLIGDMTEAAVIGIMKAAELPVEETKGKVELKIGGINLKGEYDMKLEGGIWDIKSASKYAFSHKFAAADGFNKLREDDPFGYITQGVLYGEAEGSGFAGWIVVNKETGEWGVLRYPKDEKLTASILKQADKAIRELKSDAPFVRGFELVEESFNKKKTGNYYLPVTCVYCNFKQTCWGKLTYAPQPASKAVFPKRFWYVGEPQ